MDDPLETAARLKSAADRALLESGALACLNRLGQVHFHGSYACDTMAAPEIDVIVLLPEYSRERASAAAAELLRVLQPTTSFVQFNRRRDTLLPDEYRCCIAELYLGLPGVQWKLDLCFMEAAVWQAGVFREYRDRTRAQMDDGRRRAIVALKLALAGHPQYRRAAWRSNDGGFSGKTIADAVLYHGVSAPSAFLELLERERMLQKA
jgi:hypothetical protein